MVPSIRVILGIIGCAVCMLLYSAPILTFKRVIKEASVGEFSCIPYILTLFSCLTYSWYGFPVVSSGWKNLTVFLISSIGVLFEISFISIYLWFAPREKKKLVILIVSLVLAIFGMTVLISSFTIHTHHIRNVFVGSIGVLSAMLMYSSPLVAVKQVVRTRSVEFMPFYLSLFSFLTSLIWMVYGLLGRDPYITSPNCVGCATGILQLVVYCIYRSKDRPKTQNNMENDMEVATSCKDATGHKL
ncbi:hypothetical protein SEVIR_3G078400v4 [Setaria viridis]|uniref:Bidirectional sugar transporter SWEET n=1 Tax=Setaria viridis TaxID=4556 RepID=A0A4V6D992_SETVI|nr:bidirectional sugar transporter SWEET3a-like isoform X2 [Setaria viridis]TKW24876.1 hypothetical protein SEVIR_3G078400v2 [Setaria viridis]